MKLSLNPAIVESVSAQLKTANSQFNLSHPGESDDRQPVHTVYGGAHLFQSGSAEKLGRAALAHLAEYIPNFVVLAKIMSLEGHKSLPEEKRDIEPLLKLAEENPDQLKQDNPTAFFAYTIYTRVLSKLNREPVEDFRIDFEDGYGNRPDEEEDTHSVIAADEVAKGMAENSLPPFIGIRIKPLTEELKHRAIRTLDLFVTALLKKTKGELPRNFVVTLPKVTVPEQVSALVRLFDSLETNTGLSPGSLKIELMIETPQSILDSDGNTAIPALVAASQNRCVAAHFGVYDYTASSNITAAYQSMTHPICDFARHMMQVALAGTGIKISDGATNIVPIPIHRSADGQPLSEKQKEENRKVVYHAWKLNYDDIRHSLKHGYYQGWDLHPSQLPVRYAAVYSFFLEGLEAASYRLKSFMEKAARATLVGDIFDDAATGQALLNFFLKGIACGAITEDETKATGLTVDEIRTRSFNKILQRRRT
ncbi:MAG: phosphoenolpyruvate kinase [Candidatus Marinimicrobia bacterium]|nr:phosphoenolpyruvate kinase [Candidatus Neomarinimicrobiota bacterium]